MTVEEAIRDRIVSEVNPAGGVFQLVVPQNHATWPAIRVQLIDQPKLYHLRGDDKLFRSRVQVDVFQNLTGADPYEAASDLADAVDEALGPEPFTDGSSPQTLTALFAQRVDRRPTYEDGATKLVRISSDYLVWYQEV